MSKYGNKPVWVAKNGETFSAISITSKQWKEQGNLWFASKLEYLTYLAIIQFARKAKLRCDIECQHSFFLIGSTTAAKVIDWNIDFLVYFYPIGISTPIDYLYIEAKGIELPEYKLKRDLMAILHPNEFAKLVVIKNHEKVDDELIKFLDL